MMGDSYVGRPLTSGLWPDWTDYRMFIYTDLDADCTLDATTVKVTCQNEEDIKGNQEYEMWVVQMIMAAPYVERSGAGYKFTGETVYQG